MLTFGIMPFYIQLYMTDMEKDLGNTPQEQVRGDQTRYKHIEPSEYGDLNFLAKPFEPLFEIINNDNGFLFGSFRDAMRIVLDIADTQDTCGTTLEERQDFAEAMHTLMLLSKMEDKIRKILSEAKP